jgi:hypothetical protein
MPKYLISLISDQTIPNVLFIKEYEDKVNEYIFITTERMQQQGKLDWVLEATGIQEGQYESVTVVEDELISIEEALNQLQISREDEFILNLTGGTKIMSIGVYNYFSYRNSEIFYIPIGKNLYRKIFPPVKERDFVLQYRTTLQTYLTSYGIRIVNPEKINQLTKSAAFTELFFNKNYSRRYELKTLRDFKSLNKNGGINRSDFTKLFDWLEVIHFPFEQKNILNTKEITYLLGGWLEEYTYLFFKRHLNLSDDAIGIGVEISRQSVKNEFDVMFVYNNAIYVFECKTGLTQKVFYEAAVYKLAALKKDFGLFVNSNIVTMTNVKDQVWKDRAAFFNIKLLDNLSQSKGKKYINTIIKEMKK